MSTTFLNGTAWLLGGLFASATWSMVRGRPAREAFERVLRIAGSGPCLAVLAVLAFGGLGSRAVLGYLAPGVYAEEVVAARAFLSDRRLYRGDARAEFAEWLHEEPAAAAPWTIPGLSSCQAGAFKDRPQYFSGQAHVPTLLLAAVPVVHLLGGRGLYVFLLLLSLVALAATWHVLVGEAGLSVPSREAALLAVTLAGWQPVLAGIRQGDAVLIAGAWIVVAWASLRRGRLVRAGLLSGAAGAAILPALPAVLALGRWPRAFGAACLVIVAATLAAAAAGGPLLFLDFAGNVAFTARNYGVMLANYALSGRLLAVGGPAAWLAAAGLATAVVAWPGRRDADAAFAVALLAGLVLSPVAWSQHLFLATVPLAVLLGSVVRSSSAVPLAAWSLLALLLSLPDTTMGRFSLAVQSAGHRTWPLVPVAILVLGAWLIVDRHARGASAATAAPVLP